MFGKKKEKTAVTETPTQKEGGNNFDSREYLESAKSNLLGSSDTEQVVKLPLNKIRPNPYQPRKTFKKESLKGMAASIKERGILHPIIVRENNDPTAECPFDLCDGERRWRAAEIAGLTHIHAIVKNLNDKDLKTVALISNIQHEDMNFVDTMNAYVELRDLYSNAEGVANSIGKSKRTIEMYFKFHKEINSLPEFAEIFAGQAENIDFSAAQAFSVVASDIQRLQKSNQREFSRIIKNLKTKGVPACIPWLNKKFGAKDAKKPLCDDIFRETGKDFSLVIRIKKSDKITDVYREDIRQGIDKFMEKLAVMPSAEKGE